MGHASRALLAGGLGFAVSFLAACGGGSGLLSSDQADNLNSQLDRVAAAVSSGRCGDAANAITAFSNDVSNLPSSVSPTLTRNLVQGASTVAALASKDCQNQTTSTSASSPTSSTSSTSTTSTPSSTTTTTSTQTGNPATSTSAASSTTATTQTDSGTTSTTSGSGGAGLGGGGNGGGGTPGTGGNGTGQ